MRKFITILFVMLGLCASLCAEPKSSICLTANVTAGAGNEEGETYFQDGLSLWIGYVDPTDLEAATPGFGENYTDGDLKKLVAGESTDPITAELYGSGEETFDIYVAAQTNNIEKQETTISFSLEEGKNGWQHSTGASQTVSIGFRTDGYQKNGNGLYCNADGNTLTVTAEESTKTETPIYIGKASAYWQKSTDLKAGVWTANIIVTITPGNA